eukprot:c23006_g1_i1 orf=2-286(-)
MAVIHCYKNHLCSQKAVMITPCLQISSVPKKRPHFPAATSLGIKATASADQPPPGLPSTPMYFKSKYSRNIALHWFYCSAVWISHQKKVWKCCTK